MSLKLLRHQIKFKKAIEWYFDLGDDLFKNTFLDKGFKERFESLPAKFRKKNRFIGTGRSTVLAICYIEYMLEYPEVSIYPIDIPPPDSPPLFVRNKYLIDAIIRIWNNHFKEKQELFELKYTKTEASLKLIKK